MDSNGRDFCAVCRDRFHVHEGDCCGRCQRIVCRACSRVRGRWQESVLCRECAGERPAQLNRVALYRTWRRLLAG